MKYLALDQGGTKTCALVCDEDGNILGTGLAPGSCFSLLGMEHALSRCREALNNAGFTWEDMDLVSAGMAGADWPEEYAALRDALGRAAPRAEIHAMNDCEIAYYGGTDAARGVCVCAGSGVNACYVRNGEAECLGYYALVPSLGRMALDAAIDDCVGVGPRTALTKAVTEFYHVTGVEKLVRGLSDGTLREDEARFLVPSITEAAADGDEAALRICQRFALRCADYACMFLRKHGRLDTATDVVVSGGVFKEKTGLLFKLFSASVLNRAASANVINAAYEPVIGAMRRVLPEDKRENLLNQAKKWKLNRIEQTK